MATMNPRNKPIVILSKESKTKETATPHYDYLFKCKVIGDSGVGKSSLLLRYVDDSYTESYISTIGVDFKFKQNLIQGKQVKLQIWDTAGQEKFRTVTSQSERGVHAYIAVFDLTDQVTFNDVKHWIDEAKKQDPEARIFLVGAKADLVKERAVENSAINNFIDNASYEIDAYVETSAKTGENVNELFDMMSKNLLPASKVAEPNHLTLDEFKSAYREQYRSEFFKNPFSQMKKELDRLQSMADVEEYAEHHKKSRTAQVLNRLKGK